MSNAKKKDVPAPEAVEERPELTVVEKAEPITMHRMAAEVEVNTVWRMTVKSEVTPEQCMDEAFWCHVSMRMIPGDTLIVKPDDSTWKLVLNVINCGPQFAHVEKESFIELAAPGSRAALPSIYTVEHAGPIHKWRFLRDGKNMRDGFATEALARRAAQQHEMAVNRAAK